MQTQAAVEAAPAIVDPVQQTLVTLLSGYLNSPAVKRSEVRALIAQLRQPATTAQIRRLKEAYAAFNAGQDIGALLTQVKELIDAGSAPDTLSAGASRVLSRDDLRLICFDHIVS